MSAVNSIVLLSAIIAPTYDTFDGDAAVRDSVDFRVTESTDAQCPIAGTVLGSGQEGANRAGAAEQLSPLALNYLSGGET
jgi:hypothetical protein